MPPGGADPLADRFRAALAEGRERTLSLVEAVSEHDLSRQHDRLVSPLVWDLGHIAAFEDLWLCQGVGGLHPLRPELADVYDAAETPRAVRAATRHLAHREVLAFLADVRARALQVLDSTDLHAEADGIRSGRFAWEMVIQHEHQHNETMLQTLTLAAPGVYSPARPQRSPARLAAPGGNGAGGRRTVRDGRSRRALRLRQRAAPPHGGPTGLRDRSGPRDQRRLRSVHGRRRLRAGRAVDRGGSALAIRGGREAPPLLDDHGRRTAIQRHRGARPRAAGHARVVVRGRRLRALARRAPAHRGRVGEGRGARPRDR